MTSKVHNCDVVPKWICVKLSGTNIPCQWVGKFLLKSIITLFRQTSHLPIVLENSLLTRRSLGNIGTQQCYSLHWNYHGSTIFVPSGLSTINVTLHVKSFDESQGHWSLCTINSKQFVVLVNLIAHEYDNNICDLCE